MKIALIALAMTLTSFSLSAATIESSKNTVSAARVVEVVKLVNKADIQVNVVVVDNGGSTDVSPTQSLYFNIYSKGEMFSTDASFDLGYIFSLESAKRISGGVYQLEITGANEETAMPETQILEIDAQKAILALKAVQCDDFDCEASTNFKSAISVSKKTK